MRPSLQIIMYAVLLLLLSACSLAGQPVPPALTPPLESSSPASPAVKITEPTATPAPIAVGELGLLEADAPVVASPTPTPSLVQLTDGDCCVGTFWMPDGSQVAFIDRPAPDAPAGLWGVNLQGNPPEFITERLGIYSPDMGRRAFLENGQTFVEDLPSGERWLIPSDGRAISFSPDGIWLAWTAGQAGPPFDNAQREIWVSRFDGDQAVPVFTVTGGGFAGWFPDGRLLVNGRSDSQSSGQAYWTLTLEENQAEAVQVLELEPGGRLRGAEISPDGNWLVYMVTLHDNPQLNGLWLADLQTGERRRLDLFGAYRWSAGGRLLVIPLDLSQTVHQLWGIEAATGQVQALTDPAITPFKIANGDWSVSPDGQRIAFVSALDQNIWLLTLPGNR